jgi:hypothetical protein
MILLLLALSGCLGKLDKPLLTDDPTTDADLDGLSEDQGDCDDRDPDAFPGNPEICDGIDNDCNQSVDDGAGGSTWYADVDGDGLGDDGSTTVACDQPDGFVAAGGDCDDADSDVGMLTWYADADDDGYGAGLGVSACEAPEGGSVTVDGDCKDGDPAYNPGVVEDDCTDPNDYNCDGSVGYADEDGDGFAACADCDDSNAQILPGADEVCDGADNDCNGTIDVGAIDTITWYIDGDADGHGNRQYHQDACEAPDGYVALSDDCDDADDTIVGIWFPDADFDGYGDAGAAGGCVEVSGVVSDHSDCDDAAAAVHPGSAEACNGIDDDCDPGTDEVVPTWYGDGDGDGWGAGNGTTDCTAPTGTVDRDGDCDDTDPAYHPSAPETDCTDPADYNCDGSSGAADADNDAYAACEDCDDGNASVNPSATEVCDAADVDENCDGFADDASATGKTYWYVDVDADGYGDAGSGIPACDAPAARIADANDCDDLDPSVRPGAQEVCDAFAVDEDCDGVADDADSSAIGQSTWYIDLDADGFGDSSSTGSTSCVGPGGLLADRSDCDDLDATVNPDAQERCGASDEDCDGLVDDADPDVVGGTTWYVDGDGDGAGDPDRSVVACVQPTGTVSTGDDCDDADNQVTNGVFYADADGDGFGDADAPIVACGTSSGVVGDATDCDDTAATAHPGGQEVCDGVGIDEDCDGLVNGSDPDATGSVDYYTDADADGYGDPSSIALPSCDPVNGFAPDNTDCDDQTPTVHPGAAEVCDPFDADEDCDGAADDAEGAGNAVGAVQYWTDLDGDTWGTGAVHETCEALPNGVATREGDCDDSAAPIHPTATEVCNTVDDDCDGAVDAADSGIGVLPTFYRDNDADGFGGVTGSTGCFPQSGESAVGGDCNDANGAVNPDADETCATLGVDDDCDGRVDANDDDVVGNNWAYADNDLDTYGNVNDPGHAVCLYSPNETYRQGDCNDTDAQINIGRAEVCDGKDNDCDGDTDDADSNVTGRPTWYRDADVDGHGDRNVTSVKCIQPTGYVSSQDDCDDTNATIVPGGQEICDPLDKDEDCDNLADDADISATGKTAWYADTDGDTYGAGAALQACNTPSGKVASNTDCNDSRNDVHPGGQEVCDAGNADEDCDGMSDDNDPSATGQTQMYYTDVDNDGYGTGTGALKCDKPPGSASQNGDCNDAAATINPGKSEICDAANVDENCNNLADDNDPGVTGKYDWRHDNDRDGLGDPSIAGTFQCEMPVSASWNWVTNTNDCNDTDADEPGSDIACTKALNAPIEANVSGAGLRLRGAASMGLGYSAAAPIGDLDGDGRGELVLGAPFATGGASQNGAAYLISSTLLLAQSGDVLVSTSNVARGAMQGPNHVGDHAGQSVAGLGDVDGDSKTEVLVGAADADRSALTDVGQVYVFSGNSWTGTKTPADAPWSLQGASQGDKLGFALVNVPGNLTGTSAAESEPDIVASLGTQTGAVIVVSGNALSNTTAFAVGGVVLPGPNQGTNGWVTWARFNGIGGAGRTFGVGVDTMDINGDGSRDLVIGDDGIGAANAGGAWIVLGATTGIDTTPSGGDGIASHVDVQLTCEAATSRCGDSLSDAGDVDGDGYNDLIIGGIGYDLILTPSDDTGVAYVVYGAATSPASVTIDSANSTRLVGRDATDFAGMQVGAAGDVDSDERADVCIGAPGESGSGNNSGAYYLVLGGMGKGSYTLDPSTGLGKTAQAVYGELVGGDKLGQNGRCTGIGDVDADGYDDVMVTLFQQDYSTVADAGAAYVFRGSAL